MPHQIIEPLTTEYDGRVKAGTHAVTLDPGDLVIVRTHDAVIERASCFQVLVRVEAQLTPPGFSLPTS